MYLYRPKLFILSPRNYTFKLRNQTEEQYKNVIAKCNELFLKKAKDYGTSWRILRLPSITDQIFIKAQRIRSIQEKGVQKVEDGILEEFVGIINYCVIALIQFKLGSYESEELSINEVKTLYQETTDRVRDLLMNKNHDYNEAWREMRVSSITDIILMKLYRIKQIEDNSGKTVASEGVDAGYEDMINYSVFCLILLDFENN